HDDELAVFLHDHAADHDAAVLLLDLFAAVLVADDLRRIDDILGEIAQRVAIAGAGEIRADVSAFTGEVMARSAERRGKHRFPVLKAAALQSAVSKLHHIIHGVRFAGAFWRYEIGHD